MSGKEFRRFWLTALGIPALKTTLALSALFAVWTMVDFSHSTWLITFALIPLGWFYYHWLVWQSSTYTFITENKQIVIRKGVINRTELQIPLNFPPKVTFSQSLLGCLLNFGDAELSSFGEPVTFHQIGNFRAFKDALTYPGKILPEKGPSFLTTVTIGFLTGLLKLAQILAIGLVWLVRASAPLLIRLLGWLFGQVQSAISMVAKRAKSSPSIQRSDISAFHLSYESFLAFCADFILSSDHRTLPLDCTQPDGKRRYYPNGISPDVAQIYFSILRQARIITSKTNGRSEWTLRQGISTINDIRLRIPREKFNEVSNLYFRLNRIGIMTVPKTELEHNLDWAQ